jgi:hypothetical protein
VLDSSQTVPLGGTIDLSLGGRVPRSEEIVLEVGESLVERKKIELVFVRLGAHRRRA